jgi:hypothetical protein
MVIAGGPETIQLLTLVTQAIMDIGDTPDSLTQGIITLIPKREDWGGRHMGNATNSITGNNLQTDRNGL